MCFYHDEDAPLHRSPRLAHGTDRHTLVSEELHISGVTRNAKIAGFSVARLNERWILFFELTLAGITDIAYADAQELRGPWITRDILALGDGRRTQHCVLMRPAAAVVGGKIFLFYSAFDSRVSQVGCATLGGEPLHVEDQVYLTPARRFATRPSVTCALQWGQHMYAYIHAERETWACDLPDAYVGMTLAPQQSDVPVIRADQLSSDRYTLLDVRLRPGDRKVAGAVLRPPQELLLGDGIPGIARDSRIAVYGDSESLVSAIVLHLRRNGYLNATVLQGGFEAWRDCGMPLERISGAQPV